MRIKVQVYNTRKADEMTCTDSQGFSTGCPEIECGGDEDLGASANATFLF